MSLYSKAAQWRHIGRFCVHRLSDYGELVAIELAEAKTRLLRDVIALVVLAVGALFTLSFFCIAVIASAWQTPYFLASVWGVAGVWLLVSLIAFAVVRTRRPGVPLSMLRGEIQRDMDALKEVLK